MKRAGRRALVSLAILAFALALFALIAPREKVDLARHFDPAELGANLDAWLAAAESRHEGITPGTQKRIVWAGAPGARTPLAIVYLHGFSATSEEIRPVPDQVAQELGANLFYTRLAGHGRGGPAMAEPRVADWVRDLDEALAIGQKLGEKVVIVATSTGGTLAALAAADPERAQALAGVVLISPNFRVKNPASVLLTWPGARLWVPWLVGAERSFTPQNADHARYWTTSYPTVALVPMAALVKAVRGLDFGRVKVPALFIYAPDDQVVDEAETARIAAQWGAPTTVHEVGAGPGTDPSLHVIAGDIMSPGRTDEIAALIAGWIGQVAQ